MTQVNIPFPLSSSPGSSGHESAGRLINCYAEPLGKDIGAQKGYAPPQVVWRKSPGLSLFGASAFTGFRGGMLVSSSLYAAWNNRASIFTSGGVETTLTGTLNGTEKVFWARNNKTPTPDVVCCAPATGLFAVSTSAVSFLSAWGAPNSIAFMDSYFIATYGDGTLQASDQNATTFNTLNKTTAQSKPGGLTRSVPFNGQLFALGPNFGEVYSNTANPTGFPLSRSYVLQRGLLSPYAIAGHDDGFASALIWVADDFSVVQANGTPNPLKISPPDLDRLIAGVTDKTTLEASVYISQGHPKWVLSCPAFTWEFDLGSQKWNERASYGAARWRAIGGISAFGKWIAGDTTAGQLIYVNPNAFDEIGSPLAFTLESGPVANFPNRTRVARADFNFVTGVGQAEGQDPIGTDPSVGISWSDNGGISWSQEFVRKLGRQAEPQRITMLRTGMTGTQGRRWRLRVSDPVYVAFLGASQDTQLRR
ncbi:hypothetical protein JQ633_01050 [Bradyrhizobium tropiciagri]|uniref:hypothetical protein n=1 Tax=Bradyrhizobium tropiciagri TaxID=312253 RepID=UPI001BAAFA20|nr:hypothetical protein [Bradyrhizobium tropiciagri]MBR0868928.1 hypothetical protein [Bradyrhizobium tropiciagri]